MTQFKGDLFQGEFSEDDSTFYLTRVKHMETQSSLSKHQVQQLYLYLQNQSEHEDTCTITINDQIPILLTHSEIDQVIHDLTSILYDYPHS